MKKNIIITAVVAAGLALSLAACSTPVKVDTANKPVKGTEAPAVEKTTEAPAPEAGTRENPFAAGTAGKYDSTSAWTLTVGATNPDAWAAVASANQFNTPPADGNSFIMVPLHIVLDQGATQAADGADPNSSLAISYVTASGNTYDPFTASCGVIPSPQMYEVGTMYPGAQSDANICVSVPTADVAGGRWRVAAIIGADAVAWWVGA